MRCFVALWPPPAVRAAVARGAPALTSDARAVPPANYHLTLCFLGDVAEARVPALVGCVRDIAVAPFTLALAETGFFPASGVVWLAPAPVPAALPALQRAIATRLAAAGFACDPRPFRPHVTLARRSARPPGAWPGAPVAWPVADAALCRSEPAGDGVRYRVVARTGTLSVR